MKSTETSSANSDVFDESRSMPHGSAAAASVEATASTHLTGFRPTLRADPEIEKALQRIWAKREKQIERVLANAVGLHGDLQGIIGNSLPQIERMELAALTGGRNSDCTETPQP